MYRCESGILICKWRVHLKDFNLRFSKKYPYFSFGKIESELKTLKWWISGLMLNPFFFLISRLNMACSPHEFNLQKSQQISDRI